MRFLSRSSRPSRSIGLDCDDWSRTHAVPSSKLHWASDIFTNDQFFGTRPSHHAIHNRPTAWWSQLPRRVLRTGSVGLLTRRDTDPSITNVDGVWYSFATRTIGSSIHIQIVQSNGFTFWSLVQYDDGSQRDALPDLPAWVYASSPNTWAPDVQQLVGPRQLPLYMSKSSSDTFAS